jgi:hypothetical protein
MLKSELPHEVPNPVSKKASRVHHAPRGTRTGIPGKFYRIGVLEMSPAASNTANFDLPIGLLVTDCAMEGWYHPPLLE